MTQLRQDYDKFTAKDTEVLVISPEDGETVAGFWRDQALPMIGMADPGHEVASRYGQEVNLLKLGRMPSIVVLDRSGTVRFEHRALHMADFPSNEKLLALLDELNAAQREQTTQSER